MKSVEFRKRRAAIASSLDDTISQLRKGESEAERVQHVVENTGQILDGLDERFRAETGLTNMDVSFLFLAIGLQMARQYILTKFPVRQGDQESAKLTPGYQKEYSDRRHRLYNPSLEEILSNPVPFDALIGADGALKGYGSMSHRAATLGHDPVLGLIFGTANIATATLTNSSFESYHIYTNEAKRDWFRGKARTELVLGRTAEKLLYGGKEGRQIVACSLVKEIIHLRSDLYTKRSLPLPFVSQIDPKLPSTLASYGLDMANLVTVSKQASYATLINTLIAMVHGLFFDGNSDIERKLHEVRTRKILSYSNLVASTANLAVVAATEKAQLLDLGGIAVTIYRVITDAKFIRQVKEEFIFGSYRKMIMGK